MAFMMQTERLAVGPGTGTGGPKKQLASRSHAPIDVVPGLMVKRRRPSAGGGVGSVMVGVRLSLGPLDLSQRSVPGTSCARAGAGACTPSNAAIATTTVAALPFI